MTTTPEMPLSDDDMRTSGVPATDPDAGLLDPDSTDADSDSTDGADADGTDSSDADSTDSSAL